MEYVRNHAVADPGGGGGSRGSGPPPFGPRCRLFNIGPKVGPPPFCECPRVGVFFNTPHNVQGGGGACEKSCICAWTPPPLSKILDPRLSRTYVRKDVCMYIRTLVYVCMCGSTYVYTYMCVYVCTYVRMYVIIDDCSLANYNL